MLKTPDQDRPTLHRPAISFSQGAEWNAAISTYISAIPLSGDAPCVAEHMISGAPPPEAAESSAPCPHVLAPPQHFTQ